MGEDYSHYHSV